MKILLVICFLCSAPQFSYGKEGNINTTMFKGSKRLWALYQDNVASQIQSPNITQFNGANGASFGTDMGMPFSFVFGLSYYQNKDVRVAWKGTPNTPIEFYGYLMYAGIKATMVVGFFQPWIGAGYSLGVFTMSNPADRDSNNAMIAIYSRGSRTASGPFGFGGIDFHMGSSGIRLSYSLQQISTDPAVEISNQSYNMTMAQYGVGIFADY